MNYIEYSKIPSGMTVKRYEELIKERDYIYKKFKRVSLRVYSLKNTLSLLDIEHDKDRYQKVVRKLDRYEIRYSFLSNRLLEIKSKLVG
jgi:hypothetical protein